MKCSECKYWHDVKPGQSRRRCTLAAPLEGDSDDRMIAMVTGNNSCSKAEPKLEEKPKRSRKKSTEEDEQ